MKKNVTILALRSQFIKAVAVSSVFADFFEEIIVHSSQHFDANMSDVFFDELGIPYSKYHLTVGSGSHGAMTCDMLVATEEVLLEEEPNYLMLYGDKNSSIARIC